MISEEMAWQKFCHLPAHRRSEVIDFIEFLEKRSSIQANSASDLEWLQWGAGLHQDIWKELDSTQFLNEERNNWD